eukprot:CAMPEP_0204349220 /NCGR_PEP_ID=MMETSP0469-20131031/29346_1 /ASSEMBLY_ACC=CAM_ASM_000384 /TAXON_ID=2969 /ORGANISM="Oxyrrhis marina" /LENGTH=50 /DNA_ID=CAMNT_0051335359 /DNA_START=8 /DNA_END=157 /DNA_ORIENTATION=-
MGGKDCLFRGLFAPPALRCAVSALRYWQPSAGPWCPSGASCDPPPSRWSR